MQESFSQAAGRHLQDAKILCEQERWDNAVYLAGYVVECPFNPHSAGKSRDKVVLLT